jgi:NADPH-dependent curcumin reductase
MTLAVNRQIVLHARPQGEPRTDDFRLIERELPAPAEGQILLRTIYLSIDPYMRGRMNEGPSYAPPVQLGQVMVGGTVSRVMLSRHRSFRAGDWVTSSSGWQTYALSDGSDLRPLDAQLEHHSLALSLLGMPGFTAYHGLLNIGRPQPGETVVVASAAGAVGSIVGQIGKLREARVVGIAGGPDKCHYALKTLGFDACVDHHRADFIEQLGAATGKGIDVYFENVGGAIFEAVLPRLNLGARIPVCGLIAHYNESTPGTGPNKVPLLMRQILTRRLQLQGFLIFDHYASGFETFARDMTAWMAQGKMTVREDFVDGIEQAPQALIDLLAGRHFGKLIVRVGEP